MLADDNCVMVEDAASDYTGVIPTEAVRMVTSASLAEDLVAHWFSHYGPPEQMQFDSAKPHL